MQTHSLLHKMLIIVLAAFFFFTLYISYSLLSYPAPEKGEETKQTYQGNLLLALKPQDPPSAKTGLYTYSFETKALTLQDTIHDYGAPSFSSDGRVAYVATNEAGDTQLYIANTHDSEDSKTFTPPSPALIPGSSMWSKDNAAIVYEARTALPEEGDSSIEHSRIVYLNLDTGEQTILDVGARPLFQSDGSILYLKLGGVYTTTVTDGVVTGTTRIIAFEESIATTNATVALSYNGSLIVFSNPEMGILEVYEVTAPEEGSIGVRKVFRQTEVVGRSPVFSADNSAIAILQESENQKISLNIIDGATGISKQVISLEEYDQKTTSLISWSK